MRIVLVEDSYEIADPLIEFLSDMGHTVYPFREVESALSPLNDSPPDLILTDYILPGLNGMMLYRYIKSNPIFNNTRIIVMSGTRERPESVPENEFLPKPFKLSKLHEYLK